MGLGAYFFPINALSEKKCTMCHGIRKPRRLKVRGYAAPMVEHNEYLDSFLGSYAGKKICEVESNDILLHRTTIGWDMQYSLQCFDFKVVPF